MHYIWQQKDWPQFSWNKEKVLIALSRCRRAQGFLNGQLSILGIEDKDSTRGQALVEEALQTSAIEGVVLDANVVRSSVARHLGWKPIGSKRQDKEVDGLVEMLLDATDRYDQAMTAERLWGWHAALFPSGRSGMHKIHVARWRPKAVYVVSGYVGKEVIHYEAPPADKVKSEMNRFIKWWKQSGNHMDGIVRAAVAHLYFVMIHPFEDGNGRIARALMDLALVQDENISKKYYSMSHEIINRRKAYYQVLDQTGKGRMDITNWMVWFIDTLTLAMQHASSSLDAVLTKIKFWHHYDHLELNHRQRKVLNKMLQEEPTGFKGGLTRLKYIGMTKTSRATAGREIDDMLKQGVILKNEGKGRNVSYRLNLD